MRSVYSALWSSVAVCGLVGLWAVPAQASVGPPSTPVPAALWLGVTMLLGMGGVAFIRKRMRRGD
jgi:LPXTG-motif cell wall-anchored protein